MRIVHIIVGLDVGGAELMLKRLVLSFQAHASPTCRHCIISLTGIGTVGVQLRNAGVDVHILQMTSAAAFPGSLWRLALLLRKLRPSVVQTWMYHADFLGGWVGRLMGCKVIWGVRSTGIPQGRTSLIWWLIRLNAICSHFLPHKIICCAVTAKNAHLALGFAADKMIVIPNGYDFAEFAQDVPAGELVRGQMGFGKSDVVIGVVGRFDALKDFQNFVKAAKVVGLECPDAKFLMVGRGLDPHNLVLCEWIAAEGLSEKFSLAGEQASIASYMAAMDIFCLSSKQEAFPNVVVEAMAMGLPCVVTSAGDAAVIVGACGFVVPVQDPLTLGQTLIHVCRLSQAERSVIGAQGAELVRSKYDMTVIHRKYEAVYNKLTQS